MLEAFRVGVASVDPSRVTAAAMTDIDDEPVDVFAIGKASAGMTSGAVASLGARTGTVLSISDHRSDDAPGRHLIGEHPFPGPGSLAAGRAALDMVRRCEAEELLVLVSGGGSSVAEVPPPGVTISELSDLIRRLMDSGVPIAELNLVRRSLSQIKNGRLLAAAGVPVTSLIISDVIDEPASTVASGPTLSEDLDPAEVEDIVEGAGASLSPAMRNWLHTPADTAPPDHRWSVVASGKMAAAAVADHLDAEAPRSGFQGLAAPTARAFVSGAPSGFGVGYGETTVEVTGSGRGGRNTEAALAAALDIDGRDGIAFAAFATDGVDGSSGAAGAIVDGGSAERVRRAGIDPEQALADNDSATALDASGDLVVTGPTGTNVADLWVSWRER